MDSITTPSQIEIYKAFEAYDFDNDTRFQAGLQSLLGKDTSTHQEVSLADKTERAQWFYYNRFITEFDYDVYRQWKQSTGNQAVLDKNTVDAPDEQIDTTVSNEQVDSDAPTYPHSFQAICELIAAGQPVPGIRMIPNQLNEQPPSQSNLAPRRKPWEKPPI
ncbi:hypothetical protein BDF19DRAFT_429696, partial [Syncephalis fuscata]